MVSDEAALDRGHPDQRIRWWLLPSWLGLDAPLVISTWTWALSVSREAPFSRWALVSLFLTVWSIYLLDRLIDVRRCQDWSQATGRMRFGRIHQKWFWILLSTCVLVLCAMVGAGLPREILWRGLLVAIGVLLYFLAFVLPVFMRRKLPGKEIGVGIFFSLGAYAAIGYQEDGAPMFFAVATIVTFNCLVIAARDAESDRGEDSGAASLWWRSLDRDLLFLGALLASVSFILAIATVDWQFWTSISLALAGLTILHAGSNKHSDDAVRAIADFCLLTPWVVFMLPAVVPSPL